MSREPVVEWSERVVVRDGVRLACRDGGGPGTAVLLLHGLAGHAGEWDALAERLSGRHRVVAFDQRGHGASERHPGDVSRAAFVADVVAVAARLGLDRPVLVGQSLGGHTALLTAAAHPALVRALVLIGVAGCALVLVEAAPGDPDPGAPRAVGAWLDSWPVPFPSRAAAVSFFGGGPVGEGWAAGLERHEDGRRPRFDRDVMVAALAETVRRSSRPAWRRVGCPTLAVFARSSLIPGPDIDAMLARRPPAMAVSVPGTGHDLHMERPGVLDELLEGFLAGLG
ncbi:alpha/beta fold hydrolase [Streptomyces sp. WELS2]|uniref:alpha/beta fold hydrolase n=1 Tax=Streptomyces sp. WELS2 TaxID=2749435 RepID=UPI0015F08CAB|nr:alpha/beta hydrolase [Streptomyces sp. WELS2]